MSGSATELLRVVERHGDRPFLIDSDDGTILTYAELGMRARGWAAALAEVGIEPGARVCIVAGNAAVTLEVFLGCLFSRLVAVPLNSALGATELLKLARAAEPAAVLVSGQVPDTISGLDFGIPAFQIDAGGGPSSLGRSEARASVPLEIRPDDDGIVAITYTSGTTGLPTGVGHRLSSFIANGRLFAEAVGIGSGNRFYAILPMGYLGGYYNLFLLPFVNGASVVVTRGFDARMALDFWTAAARYDVNTLWLVPSIVALLLEMDRSDRGAAFCREHVELALVGTAPLPVAARLAFEQRYGVRLHENYALSETLFLTTSTPTNPAPDGTTGAPLPGIGIEIIQDVHLSPGEGEIGTRTPFLMAERHLPSKGTREHFVAGSPFATGDLGRLDDGNLRITGRKKDVIIRGGINVSPGAIEEVIAEHPAVLEVAVVGIPHKLEGEEIVAVVRLAGDAPEAETRAEIMAAARRSLPGMLRPGRIELFDELPKSSSGKVDKRALRESVTRDG